ncbi:MAG: NADH-quinone oxidoreductase subunit NuoK [Candidatus Aminicenantia bacterium]
MVPITHLLFLGTALFLLGILGVLIRRNVIIILMSIELILNGVNINLIAFSYYLNSIRGQIFALFIITVAVAEAAVCFGLIVAFMRNKDTFDIDQMNIMKG